MYTYRIYFFGLICHLGPDDKTKQQALLVRDLQHIPFVTFDGKSFSDLRDAQNVTFKLNNTPVQSDALTDAAFRHYVPSLKTLLGGAPKQEIKDSAILVDYPPSEDDGQQIPGKLSIGGLYGKQGVHRRNNTILRAMDCVARLVELTIMSHHNKLEIFKLGGQNVETKLGEVPPEGCALIGNVSYDASDIILAAAVFNKKTKTPDTPKESSGHHFHDHPGLPAADMRSAHINGAHINKYGSILDNDQPNILLDELDDCTNKNYSGHCDWVNAFIYLLSEEYPTTSTHLECGNTHWP
jgi:hypothetical protein